MVGISHEGGYGIEEEQHEGYEQERGEAHTDECSGVYLLRVLALLVGEAEEGGLHSVGEYYHEQRRIGIHIGYHSVASAGCGEFCRVERHEKIIEESSHDAAKSVDCGVLSEGF